MSYKVYLLRSVFWDKLYVGQTNDIQYRMFRHNVWKSTCYTSKYRPWRLELELEVQSRSVAMRIEKYLKKKSREFLERVVEEVELREYILNRHKAG